MSSKLSPGRLCRVYIWTYRYLTVSQNCKIDSVWSGPRNLLDFVLSISIMLVHPYNLNKLLRTSLQLQSRSNARNKEEEKKKKKRRAACNATRLCAEGLRMEIKADVVWLRLGNEAKTVYSKLLRKGAWMEN